MRHVVVVGGGMAGAHTVAALRARGYERRVTLVGAERHRPYDRPPLSKQVLLSRLDDSTLPMDWDALAVEERLGCQAVALSSGAVETTSGIIDCDAVVIATGATPIDLPDAGGRALTLRTIDDALRLREELTRGTRIVLIGAGWIGAEVATAAATKGCEVTVVEALNLPLAGALPPEIGRLVVDWYREAGVDLRLGRKVERVEASAVVMTGGPTGDERLPADVVLAGIGVRPATAWLVGSGVQMDRRGFVLVDGQLRTSMDGVYAAGDCTAFESRRYGVRLHVEHWDNARLAPATVAANLLGEGEVYDPVPYFWSQQFGRMVQYAGHHTSADTPLWRGDPSDDRWTVGWVNDHRLVALLTVRRPRDLAQGMALIARGDTIDHDRFVDLATPLAS
jgi:3-phenylpropionate/trans-cinnamate dioxygenase ferredoxin reductase subunit